MAAAWTVDDLVQRVKRKAQRPLTDLNFSDADIANVAEEELYTFLAPLIRSARTSYFLKSYQTSMVSGQAGYRLPPDASAGTIRDVWLTNPNGMVAKVVLVEPENRFVYTTSTQTAFPSAACLVADEIVFLPTPNLGTGYTLTIWYEQRRSRLKTVAECALVVTSPTTTTYTISTPTPAFTVNQRVDVIEGQPNFDLLARDAAVTVYSPPNLTLGTAIASSTRVGAYICPAGFSCIVPLPDLFHFALVYATAAALCSETSDFSTASALRGELQTRLEGLMESVEPRTTGQAPMAVNWNSPLRMNRGGG